MPNSYFRFKEFVINQDRCAMKVCTDACLFGAWVAQSERIATAKNVLDIGTGTGLLALMLAQKSGAFIDAVEIDVDAQTQAQENFTKSNWGARITLYRSSIQDYTKSNHSTYDTIISNPPFFLNALQSNNQKKNLAKHVAQLSFDTLINCAFKLLQSNGKFYVLLPNNSFAHFSDLAKEQGLFLNEQVNVRQTTSHPTFRVMSSFSKELSKISLIDLSIKNAQNNYTEEFIQLLSAYYLYL